MLIFDENTNAIVLDSNTTPLTTDYFWVLDLEIMDFTLVKLEMLEEIIAKTITLRIKGFEFNLPANWNILLFDEDTMQIDIAPVGKLAGRGDFIAFVYGPDISIVSGSHITVTNFHLREANYAPCFGKNRMLCHPIGPKEWVNVAPSDVYNKYLRNKTIGDIID